MAAGVTLNDVAKAAGVSIASASRAINGLDNVTEEIRDRVFDQFFTTKEVGRGSGQGLSLARSIVVDAHGGDISFESTPGVGTTFIVTLPIDTRH